MNPRRRRHQRIRRKRRKWDAEIEAIARMWTRLGYNVVEIDGKRL